MLYHNDTSANHAQTAQRITSQDIAQHTTTYAKHVATRGTGPSAAGKQNNKEAEMKARIKMAENAINATAVAPTGNTQRRGATANSPVTITILSSEPVKQEE